MSQRKPDLFNILLIVALTAAVIWVSIVLGKSPIGLAFGGEANLSWTHPTKNTDGSNIATITRTELNYGLCNTAKNGLLATPAPVIVPVAYPAATKTISSLDNGAWCFQARTVVTGDVSSAWTTFVWKDIVNTPMPPSNLTVTSGVAYTVIKAEDKFVLLPVGTVPAGVACDPTQSVNGKYVVPRSSVTWSGSVRPVVVLGDCG